MTRQRWFCSLCGALTSHPTLTDGYYRCPAHANLPAERDLIPPDPLTTIPTMISEIRPPQTEQSRAIRDGGVQGSRAAVPPVSRVIAREEMPPTRGSGA